MATTSQVTADSTQPQLVFAPATLAALSPAPYLLAHLQSSAAASPNSSPAPRRANGRTTREFRKPHVNIGSLSFTHGSAVVRTGNSTAVCGVRGEILNVADVPYSSGIKRRRTDVDVSAANTRGSGTSGGKHDDKEAREGASKLEELGLLVPNVELSTGCSPEHLPGNPPSATAQSLAFRVLRYLHASKVVPLQNLEIYHTHDAADSDDEDEDDEAMDVDTGEEKKQVKTLKAFWTLYIDIHIMSLDGPAFDIVWAAAMFALRSTRLPAAYWDADSQRVLCVPDLTLYRGLCVKGLPLAASFGVFAPGSGKGLSIQMDGEKQSKATKEGKAKKEAKAKKEEATEYLLADIDRFEESLCKERVMVLCDCSQGSSRIVGLEKDGGGAVGRDVMKNVVDIAKQRWKEWASVV